MDSWSGRKREMIKKKFEIWVLIDVVLYKYVQYKVNMQAMYLHLISILLRNECLWQPFSYYWKIRNIKWGGKLLLLWLLSTLTKINCPFHDKNIKRSKMSKNAFWIGFWEMFKMAKYKWENLTINHFLHQYYIVGMRRGRKISI